MVERILVDERDQTDHEGDTAVPALDVGVAPLHQQHVQEVVAELPVRHVPQDAGEGAVTDVVDAGPRPVLKQVPGDVKHVPLVPWLVVILIAIAALFQCIAHDEHMQGGVAKRICLIYQVPAKKTD